ncbi:hypothetical protein [Roseovarius aestuariivivens]|uniref:hypothetical protein n=1 Tax=Roseovarius aestuariivivens TaxID=1888910 RepID=UPI0010818B3D|nr:hypothetical protein [Roseovarius aestuariivivens]
MIYQVYRDAVSFAFFPFAITIMVFWVSGLTFLEFEGFIRKYSGTLISLGTLLLVSVLTVFAAHLSSQAAEKTAKNNRRIQAELKVAEFRQKWITDMRNDIAELVGLSFHSTKEEDFAKAYELSMKIELRLNPTEELAKSVSNCLVEVSKKSNDVERYKAISNLVLESRKYLKSEWSRLKYELEQAQILGIPS